jgi:protein gp37
MATTNIEWTGSTWNPTTGCDRISAGCDNCYALTLAKRLKAMGSAKYQTDGHPTTSGPGFGVAVHPDTLDEPLRWRKPRTVFVDSMSDLFHHQTPELFIGSVFDVMARTPQHTYQILTKRPARARSILNGWAVNGWTWRRHDHRWCGPIDGPPPNVWIGASIESADHIGRADHLRRTPAAVRFVSAEPLLGPLAGLDLTGIDWLIAGGESGPDARPVNPDWVRDLRDRCTYSRVSFFFKQWGGRTPKAGGRLLDGRVWDQMPTASINS